VAYVIPAAIVHALRHPTPTAPDFTSMKLTPADSKVWFTVHFLRFASADFPKHHCTERFYRQVMNTFGLIAQYDRMGFWTEYFTTTAGKIEFIEQAIQWPCYGDPSHTFCDTEREIARRLRQADLLGFYRQIARGERDAADRAEFARWKARFEPTGVPDDRQAHRFPLRSPRLVLLS
jgi:hypothetical protein